MQHKFTFQILALSMMITAVATVRADNLTIPAILFAVGGVATFLLGNHDDDENFHNN